MTSKVVGGDDGVPAAPSPYPASVIVSDRMATPRVGRELGGTDGAVVSEAVVDDAADDLGAGIAAAPLDQRVQVVLRGQGLRHAHVLAQEPKATDAPVAPGLGQLVGVEREVRPMETTDAHVQDARLEAPTVVGRHRDAPRRDVGQGPVAQRDRGRPAVAPHTSTINTGIPT